MRLLLTWQGKIRSGSGTDCEQRYWSPVATSFHNSEHLIKIPNLFWTASHGFYSLASTNNDIKHSLHKSWAIRSRIWSHSEREGCAKGTNPLLSHRSLCKARPRQTRNRAAAAEKIFSVCKHPDHQREPQGTSPKAFEFQPIQYLVTSVLFEETWYRNWFSPLCPK